MNTQTIQQFDVLDIDMLAAIDGGDFDPYKCVAGTAGTAIGSGVAGAGVGAGIGAAATAPVAEGLGLGPLIGAAIGWDVGVVGGGLTGYATFCR
ncbi:Blp family class II bacteriocin [Streptococcus dentapri]|uniref:Blp family class II bacteriocin n=1 Tax=Streptococcus dentapri TaxID=573564 RepID=A0ABV8D2C8_9STRE